MPRSAHTAANGRLCTPRAAPALTRPGASRSTARAAPPPRVAGARTAPRAPRSPQAARSWPAPPTASRGSAPAPRCPGCRRSRPARSRPGRSHRWATRPAASGSRSTAQGKDTPYVAARPGAAVTTQERRQHPVREARVVAAGVDDRPAPVRVAERHLAEVPVARVAQRNGDAGTRESALGTVRHAALGPERPDRVGPLARPRLPVEESRTLANCAVMLRQPSENARVVARVPDRVRADREGASAAGRRSGRQPGN